MFGSLGDIKKALQMAGQMQGKMAELKKQAATVRVVGDAGAGLVTVEANGAMEILSVKIDPSLFSGTPDAELIQDLVAGATNQALGKAKDAFKDLLQKEMGGMLPPGMEIPGF
ncbi:MAG TPA: YbaB/EbfC family nucleoid-associated protein [Planctomycetota bacterium]|nr:YbaB/EbfC family nucleoid-associated protein [Planctomycetota bacterium]